MVVLSDEETDISSALKHGKTNKKQRMLKNRRKRNLDFDSANKLRDFFIRLAQNKKPSNDGSSVEGSMIIALRIVNSWRCLIDFNSDIQKVKNNLQTHPPLGQNKKTRYFNFTLKPPELSLIYYKVKI